MCTVIVSFIVLFGKEPWQTVENLLGDLFLWKLFPITPPGVIYLETLPDTKAVLPKAVVDYVPCLEASGPVLITQVTFVI